MTHSKYYEHAGITLYHGDCREVLPYLSVDLILTDPPYGINLQNHDSDVESSRPAGWVIRGDSSQDEGNFVLSYFPQKPAIFFASPRRPWPGEWNQLLVWDKGPAVGGGGEPTMYWKLDWELVQVRYLGKLLGSRDSSVLHHWITPADSPFHPAQKPLSLMKYLISKTSHEVICDPFCGSGSTLRAAKDLGRQAIGIEIDERYCEIAASRLSQEVLAFEEATA